MRKFALPLALSLASTIAFAGPPAHKTGAANAKGVARSTEVRSDVANERANGPRLVTPARGRAHRSSRSMARAHTSHASGKTNTKQEAKKY